ncbi:hypothetical protein [Sorangium sp. So ce1099]|uniref:hypothetical protein n=1 Tax=Sorangium sp. So ce1099 TaxID=3133331 RepID=UPI003F5F40D1
MTISLPRLPVNFKKNLRGCLSAGAAREVLRPPLLCPGAAQRPEERRGGLPDEFPDPARKRRSIVIVFEPAFQDWASIQAQIPVSRRVPVELRPGCHTRKQRELAQQALDALRKEPAVASALHAWAPDASIAGFRVFVLPGDTATAALVAERLGSIANVWFSRPFGNH